MILNLPCRTILATIELAMRVYSWAFVALLCLLGSGPSAFPSPQITEGSAPNHLKGQLLIATIDIDSNYYSLPLGRMARTEAPRNQERAPDRTDGRGERRTVAETVGRQGRQQEIGNFGAFRWAQADGGRVRG